MPCAMLFASKHRKTITSEHFHETEQIYLSLVKTDKHIIAIDIHQPGAMYSDSEGEYPIDTDANRKSDLGHIYTIQREYV